MKHEGKLQGKDTGVTHATKVEIPYQCHEPFKPRLLREENRCEIDGFLIVVIGEPGAVVNDTKVVNRWDRSLNAGSLNGSDCIG